ncbi:hypothetical protein SEVIR_2G050550v4 [Setaria viridis]
MFSEITPFFHRALPSPVSVATRRARFRHCCLRRLLSPPRPASVATRRAAAVAHQARRWTAGDDPIRWRTRSLPPTFRVPLVFATFVDQTQWPSVSDITLQHIFQDTYHEDKRDALG